MSKTLVTLTSIACSTVLLAASTAAAQSAGRKAQTDPDTAELAAYRLTTATLQKVVVATQALAQTMQDDPQFKRQAAAEKELKALRAKEEPSDADEERIEALERQIAEAKHAQSSGKHNVETISDMERSIAAVPHMSEALAKAGLSAREFSKFSLVMLQAGMVAAMKKAGAISAIPPEIRVAPENIQFMVDHEKEITELTRQMNQLR